MDRLARLIAFRQFGRLRHLRSVVPCPPIDSSSEPIQGGAPSLPVSTQPSAMPAFARVSLQSTIHPEPGRRAPVRVYHGPSRVILVGTVDAVCRMIDRCIDEERAGLRTAVQLG